MKLKSTLNIKQKYSRIYLSQNSFRSMKKGVAEELLIKDLSSSTLTEKIRLLLSDTKYKNNMVAASNAFRDQKDSPLERGLWWIEWAMRNPDAVHFKSSGTNLSFVEIQSIDVIAFLTLILVVVTFVVLVIIRKLLRLILCPRRKDSKSKHE